MDRTTRAAQDSEGEPDWDAELQIFKQRTLKPSQLEVQRKLAAEQVEVGRVSARAVAGGTGRRRRRCRCQAAGLPPTGSSACGW